MLGIALVIYMNVRNKMNHPLWTQLFFYIDILMDLQYIMQLYNARWCRNCILS